MAEVVRSEDEYARVKSVLEGKRFLIAAILLAVAIAANEIICFYQTYYEANASLTLLWGALHIFYEWFRTAIWLGILSGLVSFIVKWRKNAPNPAGGLRVVIVFLIIHLIISALLSGVYFGILGSIRMFSLAAGSVLGYNLVLIAYLAKWDGYLRGTRRTTPNPLFVMIFIVGFSLFLIFHYYYMRSGGTYDVSGYKPLYAIDTPSLKIASMLLLQVALLFVISVVFAPVAKTNIHRIATLMTAGLALFAIIAIGINELGTTHYRFRTYQAELGGSLDITITNGDSTIAPIPFLQITNSEASDVWSLSSYLAMFDYDPAEHLDQIPSIDEKFMTTLCMAKSTYVGDLDVFDADQDRLSGHHDWVQLDQLESGTYYIVATLIEKGDPGLRHGWYLFILNVE